jgi:hypothetical protein
MSAAVSALHQSVKEQRTFHHVGSSTMHSMYEALARERMREQAQHAREARLGRELAAERRWHRVAVRARAAEQRHARRAHHLSAR